MTSPKNLAQWTPGAWEHVTAFEYGETLVIGGAFTDPADVERMRLAMIRHPTNDGGYVHWSEDVHAWQYVPPHRAPKPRHYHPSLVAHRPAH